MVTRDGGVGAEEVLADGLALGVRGGEVRGDGDVLADWEAENRVGGWEFEAVAVGVAVSGISHKGAQTRALTLRHCGK